jgi:hypothetical protein
MNRLSPGLVAVHAGRIALIYLAAGLIFGLVAVMAAAFIAWPSDGFTFICGLILGIATILVIRRFHKRKPATAILTSIADWAA